MRATRGSKRIIPVFGEALRNFIHQGAAVVIKELASRPDVLVRSSKESYSSLEEAQKTTRHLSKEEEQFRLLQEKYNIAMPEFQTFIAENDNGKIKIFTIV